MTERRIAWAIGLALIGLPLPARPVMAAPILLTAEPIIGYERVQKTIPTAHRVNRLMYGARVSFGFPLLSLETEYTRGDDTENIDSVTSEHDVDNRYKLGLRSSLRLNRRLTLQVRGGGQASSNTHEETIGGSTTRVQSPYEYHPYAGAGLAFGIGSRVVLSGGLTAVFHDFPDMGKNDYQGNLGFSIRFN